MMRRGPARLACAAALALAAGQGCVDSVAAPPPTRPGLPTVAPAVDLDPDPKVVEVHVEAAPAEVDYGGDGRATRVLAYRDAGSGAAATVPGPLIVANVGDTVVVHLTNRIPDRTTTIHWHGLRLPAAMDGNPAVSGAVDPDETFTYTFTARDAGLFWYHPHVDPDEQMELGLHGPLLVRGPDEPADLVERVLVLDDVDLDGDGQLHLELDDADIAMGRHGAAILVNGRERPSIAVATGTTERWRVVNAANGRYFALELPGHEFVVVGGDGGPLPAAEVTATLRVAPGERRDVLVTITAEPGTYAWLRGAAVDRGHMEVPAFDLLELRAGDATGEPPAVDPTRFVAAVDALPVTPRTLTRRLRLAEELDHPTGPRFTINDESWPFNTPMAAVAGVVEVWELENEGDGSHPFHLHGSFFQVLSRDGVDAPAPAWKDTVDIGAHELLRLAVRPETPGMWMFHCQIPEHAEGGMMGDLMVMETQGSH